MLTRRMSKIERSSPCPTTSEIKPKVTCLCATRGRYQLLRSSVSYFLLQDYPNKELIIFNNHAVDIELSDFLKNQGNIHLINAGEFSSIADVYNTAFSYVDSFGENTSEFIAIWDDDDIYLPWHLSTAVKWLSENPTYQYCGPREQLAIDSDNEHYPKLIVWRNFCEGRILVRKSHLDLYGFGPHSEGDNPSYPHLAWWYSGSLLQYPWQDNSFVYFWRDQSRIQKYTHLQNGPNKEKNTDSGEGEPLQPGPTYYNFIQDNLYLKTMEEEYTEEEKAYVVNRINQYDWKRFEEPVKLRDPKLTLLFVGHDVYTPWTEMSIDHFKDLPFPKYHFSHNIPVQNSGVINVLTPYFLEKGEDDGFNYLGKDLFLDRLIECLSVVHTDYVWYIMPDHLYTKLPSLGLIQSEYLECMDYWDLDQLKIHPLAAYGDGEKEAQVIHDRNGVVIKYSGGSHYPVSHHATIYKKSWLLESLKEVKRTGGWSNQDHELYYWIGHGRDRGVDKLKYTHVDANPFKVAEVVNPDVEIYSTIQLGKLNSAGVEYLKRKCSHPNKALYESLKEGDEVFSKEL